MTQVQPDLKSAGDIFEELNETEIWQRLSRAWRHADNSEDAYSLRKVERLSALHWMRSMQNAPTKFGHVFFRLRLGGWILGDRRGHGVELSSANCIPRPMLSWTFCELVHAVRLTDVDGGFPRPFAWKSQ